MKKASWSYLIVMGFFLTSCAKQNSPVDASADDGSCTWGFVNSYNTVVKSATQWRSALTQTGPQSEASSEGALFLQVSCGQLQQSFKSGSSCKATEAFNGNERQASTDDIKVVCDSAQTYMQNKQTGKPQAEKILPDTTALKYITK